VASVEDVILVAHHQAIAWRLAPEEAVAASGGLLGLGVGAAAT